MFLFMNYLITQTININLLRTMKKLLMIGAVALLASCAAPQEKEAPPPPPVERAIGFNTFLADKQWHLGTEEAIQLVKDLDKVWAEQDYDAMKTFFADTCKFYSPDGNVFNSPDEFIENMKAENEGAEFSWTFDYAYSVDLDPTMGGEHVQAGFTGTSMKDGVETKKRYHESYYIVQGKIVMWNQYAQEVKED